MKNIFIAGGAGYIASTCTGYMLDPGYQVTVYDSLVTGHRKAVDPRPRLIACSDFAREELGWQPQFENAEAIIRSVWNWMAKFPNGYQDR